MQIASHCKSTREGFKGVYVFAQTISIVLQHLKRELLKLEISSVRESYAGYHERTYSAQR